MKFKHRTLISLAGCVWFAIGTFLLTLGIHFVMETLRDPALAELPARFSLLKVIGHFVTGTQNGIVTLLMFGLVLGFIKGRFALAKTAKKQVTRISSLPNPAHIKHLYTRGHYLLIGCMICLGISLRFIPITLDTRGFVDVVVGAALMNGAMLYFRSAINYRYIKGRKT